jgi:2-polyprenylphenol 6-hydroxylase
MLLKIQFYRFITLCNKKNSLNNKIIDSGETDLISENVKAINTLDENVVNILLQNGETIETKLLIGSDGANSFVRQSLSFPTISYNYNQKALVTFVKTNELNDTCYQKFLPTGPIAMLPVKK